LRIPSDDSVLFERPDRTFRLYALRGGMNRLLFVSDKTDLSPVRLEVFFMYVQYLAVAMYLEGLTIRDVTPQYPDIATRPWRIRNVSDTDFSAFEIRSSNATGLIVASAISFGTSDAEASEPGEHFTLGPSPEYWTFLISDD